MAKVYPGYSWSCMPDIERYDAVVLGTGEAGKFMAWHLGSSGKRTAVIERKYIGGACPNVACLPSKNVIQSAKVASYFQRGQEFGMLTDKWTVSMPGVRARKRQMVDGLHQMHMENFARSKAEIVMGEGRFIGDRTLKVSLHGGGERILHGDPRTFADSRWWLCRSRICPGYASSGQPRNHHGAQ
jgi:pyruvate/2-oxoglutarate dehydrogenase complex dihydrolipoamide dehydrogenase (E3) component